LPARASIVWFRQDLRLQDNPAFQAAVGRGGPVVPIYVLDDAGEGRWPMGGASRWWLHHSLESLDLSLRRLGSRLLLARGDSGEILRHLVRRTGAGAIYWNRRHEPSATARDATIEAEFASAGVEARSFNGELLHAPHLVANRQGRPYQVFTPYWRHCLTLPVEPPVRFRAFRLPGPPTWPKSLDLPELRLLPGTRWDSGFGALWKPGEAGAAGRLRRFAAGAIGTYAARRNFPALDGTSMLSPFLHFGEISPRQVWAAAKAQKVDPSVFLGEIGWREFAHHLLHYFPDTPEVPLRPEFARFPWAEDRKGSLLRAWQKGRTGYPFVDAGMRQLWQTGWMHNRVRMVVASFLVKHLRLPWQLGAAWFWDTLVDADLANNTLGWQWSTGCGADAAPYFRIFAPVLQGLKFDPDGDYVRRWVPELARLPQRYIHSPWEAPGPVLAAAGVALGGNYPRPIVDHAAARAAALKAFRQLRR